MKTRLLPALAACLSVLCALPVEGVAQQLPPGFRQEVLFSPADFNHPDPAPGNENRIPSVVTLETFPDGRIFLGTGDSRAYLWDPVNGYNLEGKAFLPQYFFDYRGFSAGEMGVTGAVAAPDYLETGHFFVSYVYWPYPWTDASTRRIQIRRFTADLTNPSAVIPDEDILIFDIPDEWSTDFHFSGGIEIGPDDYLYLTLGDDANVANPQNPNNFRGKVLRMNLDGTPVSTNPDYLDGTLLPRNYIYALGFRNPFRILYDRSNDLLFATDTGQSAWEEINIIEKGMNYGWSLIEGPLSDNPGVTPPTNYVDPYYTYPHGVQDLQGQAVVGMVIMDDRMFPPEYAGDLFVSDWGNFFDDSPGEIFRLERDESGALERVSSWYTMPPRTNGMADMCIAPDGSLLAAQTGSFYGQVFRFSYTPPDDPPTVSISADPIQGEAPLSVSFDAAVVDEGTPTLLWELDQHGDTRSESAFEYVYSEPGIYNVTLTATDEFNSIATDTVTISVFETIPNLDLSARLFDASGATPVAVPGTLELFQSDGVTPVGSTTGTIDALELTTGTLEVTLPGLRVSGPYLLGRVTAPGLVPRDVAIPVSGGLDEDIYLSENAIRAQAVFVPELVDPDPLDLWLSVEDSNGVSTPYRLPAGRDFLPPLDASGYPSGLLTDAALGAYFPIRTADLGSGFQIAGNFEGRYAGYFLETVQLGALEEGATDTQVEVLYITGGEACGELVPGTIVQVDFQEVERIFTTYCIGCHSHVEPYMGLDLSPGFAFSSVVNKRSVEVPELFLFEQRPPAYGNTTDQYLLEKINCLVPSVGSAMPPFGLMSGKERRDIAIWLRAGAKNSANPPARVSAWGSANVATSPAAIQFRGGADAPNPPFTFEWQFGDGSSSDEPHPRKTFVAFDEPTTYTVTLAVSDKNGLSVGGSTWEVGVYPAEPDAGNLPPVPDLVLPFEPEPLESVVLDASGSVDPDGSITVYSWDFDNDGVPEYSGPESSFEWTPPRAGHFRITLTVTDNDGAYRSTALVQTVGDPLPDAWLLY